MNKVIENKIVRKVFGICALVFVSLIAGSCNYKRPDVTEVDFSQAASQSEEAISNDSLPVLRVAIAPVISPRESFVYYQELFEYMGAHLNMKIEFRQRSSYEEVNHMLERNRVDLAFICTGAYIDGSQGMDLLVGPQLNGSMLYQAYIITSKQSDIDAFEDFKGRRFAYTDPLSFTGRLYPDKRIRDLGEDPANFFESVQFTQGHDVSVQMVSRNLVDGASVNGLIYGYMEANHPEMTQNIKIIDRSEYFGVPPIVTSLLMPQDLFIRIQSLFTSLHNDPKGKAILDHLGIERFVVVEDSLYNSARKIRN